MLSIASIVSLAVGIWEDYSPRHPPDEPRVGWVEGTAILVAVLAVVLTNAVNDYQKEAQFKKLNAKKEDRTVKVLRGGREQQISVYDLNVGDVLMLEPGDIIPVDGLFLKGHNVACDESSATGESDTMKKHPEGHPDGGDCFILSGSKVLEGVGRCVVIAVGENSFFGKTMMSMRGDEAEGTPLQMKLDILAEQIAKMGFAAALLMLVVLVGKYFITAALSPQFPPAADIAAAMISIVIQAITIIVVAVPEGLPMAVTMALAFATTQMLKDNNLVRVLAACETMGNATAICSDKTGTLTQNKMTVTHGTLAEEEFDKPEEGKHWAKELQDTDVVDLFIETVAVNSTAFEDKGENGRIEFIGSKTECALLDFTKMIGSDYKDIRHDATVAKVYPFASKRKTMTTITETKENSAKTPGQSDYRMHTKGASEIVLESCKYYTDKSGQVKDLDQAATDRFNNIISTYADKALRTIALAYRDLSNGDFGGVSDDEPPLENLILIGIVGIMDPLRPGVVESVAAFRHAGVFVRMITGDNLNTAKAIARNAGILTKGGLAMTGPELRSMTEEEQRKVIPRLQVLARSSPTDKTVVVTRLQEQDQVVGMTGDGTNDGPALKLADVGFSMGIAGTEVAKEASDIILMDDNFNSILKALLWGRAVNDGVRKFLTFQLTVNIAAVVLSFISSVLSENAESVLSAVQLLWVNLIMDTLAALALATEPPTDDLLDRKPISKNAHLINYRMSKMILGQAIFQIIINLLAIYLGGRIFHLGDSVHEQQVLRTMVFNIFVFLQVFNEINCRRIDTSINVFKDIFDNWIFVAVQVVVVLGQFLIVTFGGIAFKTVPLTLDQWIITVLIGALSIPIGTIIRLVPDCGCQDTFNEEAKPLASYSRMNWEGAIGDVRDELRVYSFLRRPHRSSRRDTQQQRRGSYLSTYEQRQQQQQQHRHQRTLSAPHQHYGATNENTKNRFANLVA
ncbi:PMCA-type calcium-translocating P-type ATPase, partial [Backusella circina FSU 941]